jgi:hypothetical protein
VAEVNPHLRLIKEARASWLYPIYVPSYTRAGRAPFLEQLHGTPLTVRNRVHIVVRPEDKSDYRNSYPWAKIVVEAQPGIGPARMRCLIDAEARGYSRIVVVDDDIEKVSLLRRVVRPGQPDYAQRYSSSITGISKPALTVRTLAATCLLADGVFALREDAAYGAARNALFAGPVADPRIGAMLHKQSFPACVMLIDVERFRMREMPEPFHYHGEDLAMFLDTLESGQRAFQLPAVAYDQNSTIRTTIPLDPLDEVGRPHLEYTPEFYPNVHPFLRASVKNKLGGVMRIGVNWNRLYKATGTGPDIIPMNELLQATKEI